MTDKNFFTKMPYLIFISLTTLAIWYFGQVQLGMFIVQDWGLLGFAAIILILLLVMKNTIYVIPFLLNALFMISQTEWDTTSIPLSLYIAGGTLIVGFIAHVLIYRVNIFKGKFFISLAVLAIAAIISTIINTEEFEMVTLIIYIGVVLYLFIYGFFTNTVKGDHMLYLLRIFTVLGVLVTAQVAFFYLGLEDINYALEHKTLDLGWGLSNFVATYLIMFISTTVYFIKKYKLHIFWIILVLLEVVALIFTLSRAGIIAFAGTVVLLVIFMFVKYDHKWRLLLNLVIGCVVVSAVAYFFRDYFITIWERLDLYGLDDNGRIELWEEAWSKFLQYPYFGAGIFARETATAANELRMYHNTILEILACFGAFGGVALLMQGIAACIVFFPNMTQQKAIVMIALIGVNAQGMVDNIYLMPQYMILFFIILAFVENANKIEKLRKELRVH